MTRQIAVLCAAALFAGCAHEKASETKTEQPAAQAAAPAAKADGIIPITTSSPEAAAAYQEGFDWLFTGHGDRARERWHRALELDPNLLLAQAWLQAISPGTASMQKVDAAAQAGAQLPEAERTELMFIAASKHGDDERIQQLELKMLSLAPREPRAHVYAALTALFTAHHPEEAAGHLREAAALNPKATAPWALLAAVADEQGDKAGVAEARSKVAQMHPDDPAMQADYANALLTAGKLDQAEQVARKAAAMPNADDKPLAALAGIELYKSEWAQGRQDLDKARSLATDPARRLGLAEFGIMTHVAEGKYEAALDAASALEAQAQEAKDPNFVVTAGIDRALAGAMLGKYAEARKHVAAALARAATDPLSDVGRKNLTRFGWFTQMWAEALGNDAAAAEKTLAVLEKDAADSPNDANVASTAAWARGLYKLSKGDAKGAAEEMAKCLRSDDVCHFHLVLAQEKAGDKAAAQATRAALLAQQRAQDGVYLALRAQLLRQ